jgi:hypothetical protein
MKVSEITLDEIIKYLQMFNPIKVMFNDLVIYNDYDSEIEVEEGLYGEILPLVVVAPSRIKNFEKSIVTSINIDIVEFHHSIIRIQGEYIESK